MQPLVLQYGRLAEAERRRKRRVATLRPATDMVVVRGVKILFFLTGRVSRGRLCALRGLATPGSLVTARIMRAGARVVVSKPGTMAGAGWAQPAIRLCGPSNHDRKPLIRQTPRGTGFQRSFRNP